jgi:phosphoglycerol transferase MdoB-like AlkP superfamily enzyme
MMWNLWRTWRALKFLITAPLLLVLLFFVNLLASPGHWWVQWAALGIGFLWLVSLMRVIRAAILLGGLAALIALLRNKYGPRTGS